MNANLEALLTNIEEYVRTVFGNADTRKLIYHNFEHTANVVRYAKEISGHYSLSEEAIFILLSAAWFHDTGHLYGELENHEERSVDVAGFFLFDKNLDEEMLAGIKTCIMATKMPAHPSGILQEIICDADTYHLGTPDFFEKNERVWDEMEARLEIKVTNRAVKSISFLESHQFYTTYCREKLTEQKNRNIDKLKGRF